MEEIDSETKLQEEVAWCIDQLLQSLNSGKLSERKGNNYNLDVNTTQLSYWSLIALKDEFKYH